jgi:hypothetical protein
MPVVLFQVVHANFAPSLFSFVALSILVVHRSISFFYYFFFENKFQNRLSCLIEQYSLISVTFFTDFQYKYLFSQKKVMNHPTRISVSIKS